MSHSEAVAVDQLTHNEELSKGSGRGPAREGGTMRRVWIQGTFMR